MRIKSLKLNNFRQYRDFYIKFDIDNPEKNITVVRAPNSTGKTTLMQSIKWVLFGEEVVELDKTTDFINSDELAGMRNSGEDKSSYSVEIEVVEQGELYKIKRVQEVIITPSLVKKGSLKISIEYKEQGQTKILNNKNKEAEKVIQRKINALLSRQMVNYFLFDGERIEKLSNKGSIAKRELSNAITAVSKIPILKNSLSTLNDLEKNIRKNMAHSLSNSEFEDMENTISTQEEIISMDKERLSQEKILLEELEEEKKKIDEKMSDIQSITRIQAERKKLDNSLDKLNNEKEETYEKIHLKFTEYETSKYIHLLQRKYSDLKLTESQENKAIPNMDTTALQAIIDRGVCVCGTNLEKKHIKSINEQMNYQPPISLDAMMKGYEMFSNKYTNLIDRLVTEIREEINRYHKYIDEISDIKMQLKEIDDKLNVSDEKEIKKLNQTRTSIVDKLQDLNYSVRKLNEDISTNENDLLGNKKKFKELEKQLGINEIYKIQDEIVQQSIANLNRKKKADEERLRTDIQTFANKHLKEIISKPKTIIINEDFTHSVIEENGKPSSPSSGESVAISFSLILAFIDTHKKNLLSKNTDNLLSDRDFFVVMDGPFATLDQFFSQSIAEKIVEKLDQVILLTNDVQYTDSIKSAFNNKISKEYLLNIPPSTRKDSVKTEDLEVIIDEN